MPGKLDVYNLGERGVVLVKSPVHEDDGDLILAQNATPDPAGLEGGIRKRDGMTKLNAVAMTGSIEGAASIPLPAPGTRTYYVGQQEMSGVQPSDTWYSSLGGITWAGRSTPSLPAAIWIMDVGGTAGHGAAISFRRRFFYSGYIIVGSESAVIRVWDGATDTELCRAPNAQGSVIRTETIRHLWMHRGFLYAIARATASTAILRINIVTGSLERVGAEFGATNAACFGLSFLDRVWVGFEATNGLLYSFRNGAEAWVLERTAAAATHYTHGVNYKGDLYVGTLYQPGTAAIVEKRLTSTGAWSTSLTGPDTSLNLFTCFAVFNGELYCVYKSTTSLLVKKFDGSSWVTDLDVLGVPFVNAEPSGVLAETDALYIVFSQPSPAYAEGYVLRRTTAGAWSKVADPPNSNGMIAYLP